ncbi:hypothetical protein DFR27_1715 [Umboniibacter marinipuniceus]|uniref:Uncharacterized protein n=1 Tax=Umboniibacter marinipuniceus TaxID=569599 RepID=A0A3M0A3Q0_9GAMM|nr:hypothetical protein DFR27_1715 [Umboniibacter marinipuniceus]
MIRKQRILLKSAFWGTASLVYAGCSSINGTFSYEGFAVWLACSYPAFTFIFGLDLYWAPLRLSYDKPSHRKLLLLLHLCALSVLISFVVRWLPFGTNLTPVSMSDSHSLPYPYALEGNASFVGGTFASPLGGIVTGTGHIGGALIEPSNSFTVGADLAAYSHSGKSRVLSFKDVPAYVAEGLGRACGCGE